MKLPAIILASGLALSLVGCGDNKTTTSGSNATTTTAASSGATTTAASGNGASVVKLGDNPKYGKILVDGDGNTLYTFVPDTATTSVCNEGCSSTWPPLEGPATGSGGVGADDLKTLTRADGTTQATFYNHPVYRYSGDSAPGNTNGEGIGGKWYVVDKDGNAVKKASSGSSGTTVTSGNGY